MRNFEEEVVGANVWGAGGHVNGAKLQQKLLQPNSVLRTSYTQGHLTLNSAMKFFIMVIIVMLSYPEVRGKV